MQKQKWLFESYIENNITTEQMVYIKNLENQSNFNFNKKIDSQVLTLYVIRLVWLVIIFFINLKLFGQFTKIWVAMQLAASALLNLWNYFS